MPLYPDSSLGQTNSPLNVSIKGPDLPCVSDIRELDMLQTQANGRYVRFDANDDVFYIVSTNDNNYKTVNRYRFYEDPIPKPEDNFATKQEMEELKGGLTDVQLAIQELTNAIRSSNQYSSKPKQHGGQSKPNVSNGQEQFKSNTNASTDGNEQSQIKGSL